MIRNRRRLIASAATVLGFIAAWVIVDRWRSDNQHRVLTTVTSRPLGVMGTECTLTVVVGKGETAKARTALAQSEATLRSIESLLSTYVDDSEVTRLNSASAFERVALSRQTLDVLRRAREFARLTNGAFDVTASPMFRLWKFCATGNRLPTRTEFARARAASNWDAIELSENGATKKASTAEVDLGGIAKGYAIDRAIETMMAAGCQGGLVDVGGDIRCFGAKPGGEAWRIAVRHPSGRGEVGQLRIESGAVCTSGNYARFVEINGRRYSHIIDPRSGIPIDATPSVTVTAPDAMTADAWATALSVLGPDGLELLPDSQDIQAMVVTGGPNNHRTDTTDGFQRLEKPGGT